MKVLGFSTPEFPLSKRSFKELRTQFSVFRGQFKDLSGPMSELRQRLPEIAKIKELREPITEFRDQIEIWRERMMSFVREMVLVQAAADRSVFQVKPGDEGWVIFEKSSNIQFKTYPRKQDAIRAAKKMAREKSAELDVLTKQGSVQHHFSFL